MKIIYMCTLALFLSFFSFHGKTVSPAGQVVSIDEANAQAGIDMDKLTELAESRSSEALLDTRALKQLPELYNGCEVTSLAMLLGAEGITVDKVELAKQIKKDPTELKGNPPNEIIQWGDPNYGFVGDVTGRTKGYGVNSGPIFNLLKKYTPNRAVDLTGSNFHTVEWMIDQGNPVIAWTTTSFQPTDEWVTWKKGEQTIRATFKEHVVLLVGYDKNDVYVNDPLTGERNLKIGKSNFLDSWKQMGSQAVSILGNHPMLALKDSQ